jgi:hypothetical protein
MGNESLRTRSGRNPSQNEFELRSFISLLQGHGVTRYCEIGARHGDTFFEVVTSLPAGSAGLAVDLPGALWGTSKSRNSLNEAVSDLQRRGYQANALFGDSQTTETQCAVADRGPFDAILIDGDHTLAGVTRDWNMYRNLAPMIAFHDIVGAGQIEKVGGRPVEVPLLWAQLREKYRHVEFIDNDSKMGIGVLWTA